jgi:hypothetical protein
VELTGEVILKAVFILLAVVGLLMLVHSLRSRPDRNS